MIEKILQIKRGVNMLKIIPKDKHKKYIDYQGIQSYFHFSYDNYYSPANLFYGVIYGLNDYTISPNSGLKPTKNQNIEVITYVYEGTLTHVNSLNKTAILPRGSLNYLSSGTGLSHSERNIDRKLLKMITFFIVPNQFNTKPHFESVYANPVHRLNKLTKMIGNDENDLLSIKQDFEFYVCDSEGDQYYNHSIEANRQAYIVCLKGRLNLNGQILEEQGAARIEKTQLKIESLEASTFILIDMCKTIDFRTHRKSKN